MISTQISSICVFCDDIKYRKNNYLNFSYDHLSMYTLSYTTFFIIFHHFFLVFRALIPCQVRSV